MSARIDLHTHSNESDGTDTPLELLNKVAEAEIDRFALTDHDSIAGWQQIKDLVPSGIELVIGAEVSCQTVDALSVHMLGFLFDPENKALIDSMNETRGNRITRMERIVGRLQEAGINISVEDVYAEVSEGATIGRPHLADAMIRKGIVSERGEAFERFLHNRSKFYIPDASPTPEEAIRLIKEAGGVAVIAHPFGGIISSEYLESLIDAGLDGIEIFHRDHSEGERDQLFALVRRYALLVTGGSDYHGKRKVNRLGENLTELSQWEKISERATGYTKGA